MTLHSLKHLLVLDVPEYDISIFASRGNECFTVEDGKTAPDGEFLIAMALISLFNTSRNIVPKADAVVEVEGEDEAAVGGETYVAYGRIVFVNKRS